MLCHFSGCAGDYDLAPLLSSGWSHVNDMIGNPNELQVVFDQNQGVSRCEQVFKAIEQVLYIQGMEASAWFIHQEQCTFTTAGREVSCQFESLTFSTGKGWEWLTQGDITQSHIFELL